VQEAQKKIEELGSVAAWHFIGHLQTNKAKVAVVSSTGSILWTACGWPRS
jgi:uncharacterized pyridoxal phosphate-containing UPF0001 family protein